MIKLINIIIIIIIINFIIPYALAVDASPSSEIKSKLEELKKGIASKAAKLKREVAQKLTNKSYVGTVENKTNNSLTVITKNGAKIVTINQDTVSPKTLNLKNYVAALGDIDDTGVLTAKKIIALEGVGSPHPEEERVFYYCLLISKKFDLQISNSERI